jgi:hypothetical protein
MSRYAFPAMLAALALTASALIAASSPHPSKLTVLISAQASAPASGACPAVTYPLKCPSLNCQCVMYTGSFHGTLGRGNLSSMALTLDQGDATPSSNCTPVFGVVNFPAGKRFGAITLDVAGALCASTPAGGNDTVGGGFDVDPTTSGLTGSGEMLGTQNSNGGATIKLSGNLAPSGSMANPTAAPSPSASATSSASPSASPTATMGPPLGL